MKIPVISCILSLSCIAMSYGQSISDSLHHNLAMISRSYGDSVVLRWAPDSYHIWQLGNKYGYVIERWHEGLDQYEKIVGPMKPYTLAEWKQKADTTDVTVSIAAQVLHGKIRVDPNTSQAMGRKMMAHDEQNNRYVYAMVAAEFSIAAAKGLALRYCDKNLVGKSRFLYRLYIPVAGEGVDTVKIYVDTKKVYKPDLVREVSAVGKDRVVEIRWNRPLNDQAFTAYFIEKSSDGKRYVRLNRLPFISDLSIADGLQHVYSDSVQNDKKYLYRVIGVTSFSDESLPSVPVEVSAGDLTPPLEPIVSSREVANQKIEIRWKTEAKEADHDGFFVVRSASINGVYEVISVKLKKTVRSFQDPNPSSVKPNYYKVVAVDKKGNRSESLSTMGLLSDEIPPIKPTGLMGSVDSLGIVSLAWNLGSEEDLKGYRVYRANGKNREFIQITKGPIPGNFYRDTVSIRTLSKKVYYKIAAFDYHYNPSEYSEILELERPDYIPPVRPVMKSYELKQDTIHVKWIRSSSEDVKEHILFRKQAGSDWTTLKVLSDSTTQYTDLAVGSGGEYRYAIEAVDQGGLRSGMSNEISVLYKKQLYRKNVLQLNGEFDKGEKAFLLSWLYDAPGKYKFLIFRGEHQGELKIYDSVEGQARSFKDNKFYSNQTGYSYAVKVLFEDGSESLLSEEVTVLFKK